MKVMVLEDKSIGKWKFVEKDNGKYNIIFVSSIDDGETEHAGLGLALGTLDSDIRDRSVGEDKAGSQWLMAHFLQP